jgi:biopolymer transport protein ExbD
MRESRRMRRMARNHKRTSGLMLTSLMDVFTILVFFLLSNSSASEAVKAPDQIKLPTSTVETKPRETVVIMVTPTEVLVHGKVVIATSDLYNPGSDQVPAIMTRLAALQSNLIGINSRTAADSMEITILADRTIPFSALKKIMTSCTLAGYEKISLAVIQKSSNS